MVAITTAFGEISPFRGYQGERVEDIHEVEREKVDYGWGLGAIVCCDFNHSLDTRFGVLEKDAHPIMGEPARLCRKSGIPGRCEERKCLYRKE